MASDTRRPFQRDPDLGIFRLCVHARYIWLATDLTGVVVGGLAVSGLTVIVVRGVLPTRTVNRHVGVWRAGFVRVGVGIACGVTGGRLRPADLVVRLRRRRIRGRIDRRGSACGTVVCSGDTGAKAGRYGHPDPQGDRQRPDPAYVSGALTGTGGVDPRGGNSGKTGVRGRPAVCRFGAALG
jgi:hypothetical protein